MDGSLGYRRREPDGTVLYAVVSEQLEPFLRHAKETYARPLPKYVEKELRGYLGCGILAKGFTRVRCPGCRHEYLVGFSCKGRGLCPSCAARRMCGAAAHIADSVLPDVPIRQWVLSAPWELRPLLAANAGVLSAVVRIFRSAVGAWYRRSARADGIEGAEIGAVSFVQRFGGSLNLHVHEHSVFADGVFAKDANGAVTFHTARTPGLGDVTAVAAETARRVIRMLKRRTVPVEPLDEHVTIGLARGTFERIRGDAEVGEEHEIEERKRGACSAEVAGFSVHAGVQMRAGDAEGRERLLRYCARPPLALERLSRLPDGRLAYRVKHARRGKTHRVMTPMELMARLAALIPPPRYPLIRYGGVFAPASTWRPLIVPGKRREARPCEITRRDEVVKARGDGKAALVPAAPKCADVETPERRRGSYVDWATLMRRSFGLDVLACPKCGGRMKPVAVITEREVIERILTHLRLPLRPEPLQLGGVAYDVTGEPMLDEEAKCDGYERGPPDERDFVDPPAPDG